MTRFPAAMDHIQLDIIHVVELTVKRDALHIQQAAHNIHGFAHCGRRFIALDTNIACQWIPPGANPTNDPTGGQVIQGKEGGCKQPDIARPIIYNA
jgi:hypothetical protein